MADETPLEAGPQGTDQATEQTTEGGDATLAGGGAGEDTTTTTSLDDWREKMSGGDEKIANLVGRYGSLDAVGKALLEARQKISSGEYRKPLGENPSDDELRAYREANGIPLEASGYKVDLGEGFQPSEEEQERINQFLEDVALPNNLPPQTVNALLSWDQQREDQRAQELAASDAEYKKSSEDSLREQWGGDYRQNINMTLSLFDQAPEGLKDNLFGARLADGSILGNNPDALNFLVGLAREINPVAAVVPGSGANAGQAISDELGKLETMMGDPNSEYYKGPNAEKNQARWRQLYEAQQRAG